jgi:3-deoxy-D-manno-octulosonic-acid transferase
MGLWFRLAPISFLGRSLSPDGGANPYEAAALGSAVIHGPNVGNYRRAYAKLSESSACIQVRDGEELSEAVDALLSPDVAARLAHEAWAVCSSGADVTDRVRDMIFTALEEREAV